MTIKHMNKNISAEKAQVVTNITSSPNGLLVTKTNLHDEANVSDAIDLTGTKLHLMILNNNNDLDLLADCDTDNKLETLNNYFEGEYQISFDSLAQLNDYIQSKMFLIEDSTSKEEDNIYNEYIWINGDFELIGTTRIDLTNYIQKSNGTNLLLTDGTNIAQSTFAQATALTGKENTSNKVKSTSGWSSTTTDDHYPSEKLVKSSLDGKENISNKVTTISSSSTNDEYPTALTVYNALQDIGGGGLDPQEISDAAEAVGEYNNFINGIQNPQRNLLLCVKLPIMPSDEDYKAVNIRINEDNSSSYWYPFNNDNHFKEYLFADNFVSNGEKNYSIYLVDLRHNPETDTTYLIGTIDLDENTYTVNEDTYDIETKTILIELSTLNLNLSGNGDSGGVPL